MSDNRPPIETSADTVKDLTGYRVYKANALIDSAYYLSISEHRLLLAAFIQIGKKAASDDAVYRIYASDIADLSGIHETHAYRDLKSAASMLYNRSIEVFDGPNGTRPPRKRIFRWIQEVATYVHGEGCVEIRFSKPVLPYINALTQHYTIFDIRDAMQLSNSHAVRIFELLSRHRALGKVEISLEKLREYLLLEDAYPKYKDLRRRVVEVSVKQINEHTPINVEYTTLKRGRKVTHVVFHFNDESADSYKQFLGEKKAKAAEAAQKRAAKEVDKTEKGNKLAYESGATEDEMEAMRLLQDHDYGKFSLARIRQLCETMGGKKPVEAASIKIRYDIARFPKT